MESTKICLSPTAGFGTVDKACRFTYIQRWDQFVLLRPIEKLSNEHFVPNINWNFAFSRPIVYEPHAYRIGFTDEIRVLAAGPELVLIQKWREN